MNGKDFVILFAKKYEEHYGTRFEIPKTKWGKYGKQFKNLLTLYPEEQLKQMVDAFFVGLGSTYRLKSSDPIDCLVYLANNLAAKVAELNKAEVKAEEQNSLWERLEAARKANGN